MTLIIRMPRLAKWLRSRRSNGGDRTLREGGNAPARRKAQRSVPVVERLFYFVCLCLPLVTLVQTVLARAGEYEYTAVAPSSIPVETFLVGPRWGFSVPFPVKNKTMIEKLIQCESGGRNISRPDSDGVISDGILQFHRGPADTYAGGTWEDFSRSSGITGSPREPADAIRMTDWAISHGLGPHWTCWQLQKLSPGW